jgi:hypothetical protein
MRVVHLSTYAAGGGASIATYRIHRQLLKKGIDSDLIVLREPAVKLLKVHSLAPKRFGKLLDFILYKIEKAIINRYPKRKATPFSFNFFRRASVRNLELINQADLVCIYWVGEGFLTPEQIAQIQKAYCLEVV